MITTLYRILYRREALPVANAEADAHALRRATAALLMEVAGADYDISESERETIRQLVENKFGLAADEASGIAASAEQDAGEATSLYPFTRMIMAECSLDERVEIVNMLWQVTAADGKIDAHETHLVRKIADLLYVPHSEFIRTRLLHDGD